MVTILSRARRAGDLPRAALDQPCRHDDLPRRPVEAVEAREQQLRGRPPQRRRILGHHRHPRLDHVGQGDVVEAHDGDLVLEAEHVDRPDRAHRDQILTREERGGWILAPQELHRGLIGVDAPETRMPNQVEILSDVVSRQRLAVSAIALGGGEHVWAVAEEADPAVAGGDQVLDRGAGAAGVVGDGRVGVDEARRAVYEGQREARRPLAQEVGVVADGAGDDQPVDAARHERVGQLALAVGLLVGAADEGEHAALAGNVLDPAMHRAEERVRDVLEDHADRRRQAVRPPQRARGEVVAVAQQRDRVAHALGEVGSHTGTAVDHPRDRAEAHAGDRRDLAHRWPARPAPLRVLHPHNRRPYSFKKTISRLDCNERCRYGADR